MALQFSLVSISNALQHSLPDALAFVREQLIQFSVESSQFFATEALRIDYFLSRAHILLHRLSAGESLDLSFPELPPEAAQYALYGGSLAALLAASLAVVRKMQRCFCLPANDSVSEEGTLLDETERLDNGDSCVEDSDSRNLSEGHSQFVEDFESSLDESTEPVQPLAAEEHADCEATRSSHLQPEANGQERIYSQPFEPIESEVTPQSPVRIIRSTVEPPTASLATANVCESPLQSGIASTELTPLPMQAETPVAERKIQIAAIHPVKESAGLMGIEERSIRVNNASKVPLVSSYSVASMRSSSIQERAFVDERRGDPVDRLIVPYSQEKAAYPRFVYPSADSPFGPKKFPLLRLIQPSPSSLLTSNPHSRNLPARRERRIVEVDSLDNTADGSVTFETEPSGSTKRKVDEDDKLWKEQSSAKRSREVHYVRSESSDEEM